jgi:hypothetical protein
MCIKNLTELKFNSTEELIKYLQANFVFKVYQPTESILILDQSNPTKQKSREYKLCEDKEQNYYLKEV